ncbi:MAG: S8 family serine peptidase, partial [Nanoarchaeota archaeon]
MSTAIDNVVDIGIVAVVAAGNNYHGFIGSPGTARKAITIGAVDKQLNMADFSSGGPVIWYNEFLNKTLSIVKPDVVAPGVSICAAQFDDWLSDRTCLDNEHISISGTSMATPHVSGMVALIKQRNPDYTPEEIKTIIKNTAHLLSNPELITTEGFGIIDAMPSVFFDNPAIVSLEPVVQDELQINIKGDIEINNFNHYTLAYAPNLPLSELGPEDWNEITISYSIPNNRILFPDFNIVTIPDGGYLIRLQVFNTLGEIFEDYGYLGIDKFDFIEPLGGDIINLKQNLYINLRNKFNLPISNFQVDYTFNGGPWNNRGIRIISIPELRALLTENSILQDGFLDLRASIWHDGITEQKYVRSLYSDTSLKIGWPQRVSWLSVPNEPNSYFWPGSMIPVIEDINADGMEEIIVHQGGYPPKLKVFRRDGSLMWEREVGIDKSLGGDISVPLVDDLNDDGQKEIIVANTRGNIWGYETTMPLFSYNSDGSLLWESYIPRYFRPDGTLFDLDRDGVKELIIFGQYGTFNQSGDPVAKVMVLNSRTGAIISSWDLHDVLDFFVFPNLPFSPIIGNFDNDSYYEIAIVYFNENYFEPNWYELNQVTIRIFNLDGTQLWSYELPGAYIGPPSVGDVNLDGKQELIITTFDNGISSYGRETHALSVFGNSGNLLFQLFPNCDILTQPSLGDINVANQGLEILVGVRWCRGGEFSKGMYAIGSQGDILTEFIGEFFPYYPAIISTLVEGAEKVIITTDTSFASGVPFQNLYAWDQQGRIMDRFPKYGESWTFPVVVQDLDNNGVIDIISSSAWDSYIDDLGRLNAKHRSSIYVRETSFTNGNIYEWPTVNHDNQRTGCYDCLCAEGHTDNNDGTCTATLTSSRGDGRVFTSTPPGANWDIAHDTTSGDPLDYDDRTQIYSIYTRAREYGISRTFFPFDTSVIPDNANIISAKFLFRTVLIDNNDNDGNDFITLVQTTQDSHDRLINEDYDQCGNIDNPREGGNRIDISALSRDRDYNFILNDNGMSWINKQGWTLLGIREGHDVLDEAPGNANSVSIRTSESENPPKLIVTYEP